MLWFSSRTMITACRRKCRSTWNRASTPTRRCAVKDVRCRVPIGPSCLIARARPAMIPRARWRTGTIWTAIVAPIAAVLCAVRPSSGLLVITTVVMRSMSQRQSRLACTMWRRRAPSTNATVGLPGRTPTAVPNMATATMVTATNTKKAAGEFWKAFCLRSGCIRRSGECAVDGGMWAVDGSEC